MTGAVAVRRGCGTRAKGGIYGEVGLSPNGKPMESFIVDPPIVVNPEQIGLTAVGVQMVEHDGLWHVMDWVGEKYYPNVADFLEEVRHFGLSRRFPKSMDFSKLQAGSRILLVHRKAFMCSPALHWDDVWPLQWMLERWKSTCPTGQLEHVSDEFKANEGMCAGLWWQDLDRDGVRRGTTVLLSAEHNRHAECRMPSFTYEGLVSPEGAVPEYQPAIFASFPLTRLVVVNDPEGDVTPTVKKASVAGIPVDLVDE